MDTESTEIPEEYIDTLTHEFAYDPIRLPLTENPNQVLYNRRTLETIWDDKREALNPFTRQPLNLSNFIPQAELRREMQRYILNPSNLTLNLKVIPDYTQVLSEGEMIVLLNELVSYYQCLLNAEENRDPQEAHYSQVAHYWKGLWQKLNLLRLYCQYRPENREVFESIRGYDYFFKVVDDQFYLCLDESSCDDAKESLKEVCKIVDIIGLKDCNLTPDILEGLVTTLHFLVMRCDHLKIHSMVLRIYRRMFYDLNIETHLGFWVEVFFFSTVSHALCSLARENRRDISNEDLYNGLAVLKAAWLKNQNSCVNSRFNYARVLLDSVTLCISRINSLHEAPIAAEAKRIMNKNVDDRAAKNYDEVKNVELISVALERGLWLINSLVKVASVPSAKQPENNFFSEARMTLQQSDIVSEIVRMVELVLAGLTCLGSPHLQFGINIVAALLKEQGSETINNVVRVFGHFLGSDILDDYDTHVKLLLQDIMQTAKLSEQTFWKSMIRMLSCCCKTLCRLPKYLSRHFGRV